METKEGRKRFLTPLIFPEIKKAWKDEKGLVGIYIHNLRCPKTGTCTQGVNPFDQIDINGKKLSSIVKCYNPTSSDAYNSIANSIDTWIEEAIQI